MKRKKIVMKPEEQAISLNAIREIKELMKQGKAVPEVVIDGNEVTIGAHILNVFDRHKKRKELERKAKYEQRIEKKQAKYQENNSERQVINTNINNTKAWKEMYQVKKMPRVENHLNNYEGVKGYRTFDNVAER